jgi:sortase (surface protein transpeptidase)
MQDYMGRELARTRAVSPLSGQSGSVGLSGHRVMDKRVNFSPELDAGL